MVKKIPKKDGETILNEILQEAAKRDDQKYTVFTDAEPRRLTAKKGHTILIYDYAVEYGQIAAMFDAFGLTDYMTEMCGKLLDEFISTATSKKLDDSMGKIADIPLPAERRTEWINGLARIAIRSFIEYLQPKLSHALLEHELEIKVLMRGFIEQAFNGFTGLQSPVSAKKEADRLAAMIKADRRAWLVGSLDRIAGKPSFSQLAEHYQFLLPKWRDAKAVYKQNKRRAKWKEIVISAIEGVALPDDLLNRLPGPQAELAEDIQAALQRTGADSSPSNLAIEHAARLCGFKPYDNPVRGLFARIKRQAGDSDTTEAEGAH